MKAILLQLNLFSIVNNKYIIPKLIHLEKPMTQTTKRPAVMFAIAFWMAINIFLMITLIASGDWQDLNNWIEIALWAISIPAVLSMKKWGVAFAIFTLIYTLSTSMGILIYYQVWINALRVIINAAIIIYLFRRIFQEAYFPTKAKLYNLGLSLKDNTHSNLPITVSSLSSLSSMAPITNSAPADSLTEMKLASNCNRTKVEESSPSKMQSA